MQARELRELLLGRISDEHVQWLESSSEFREDRLLAAFVGAARRLGNEPLGGDSDLAHWPTSCVARVALLRALDEDLHQDAASWIQRAYREGDSGEKLAIMRALPWLRGGEVYLDIATDCGRTNETELFAALAIGNAFPSRFYPEPAFNSLVIKAAQLGLPLTAIVGLLERKNPELARIGMEYIDERQSADRDFPGALWLAIAPIQPPGAVARMLGELQHSKPERRLGAVRGLALCPSPSVQSFLQERLSMESQAGIRDAITQALSAYAS